MIYENFQLSKLNTFGLNYEAARLISIDSEEEAITLLNKENVFKTNLFILGGGSNLLFTENFKGTLLHPKIGEISIEEINSDFAIVSAGAGIRWDELAEWSVENNFWGIENLSLIPGTVGASPVQNIGAYGVEAKDVIENVRAVSLSDGSVRIFTNKECRFGYRSSIFKEELKGKYLITRVYYKLQINPLPKINYGSLNDEVNKLGSLTLENIRQAVINIRKSKLPDPEIIGNAGSFFKNPVVSKLTADKILKKYPDVPVYKENSGLIKLAAGWLVEQCGWKGKRMGDAGVHEKQALVLVNHGNATGKELYDLSERIKESVMEKFGIELEREVEVIGSI